MFEKILKHFFKFLEYRAIAFLAICYPNLSSFNRKQSFERNVGEMKNYAKLLVRGRPSMQTEGLMILGR